MFSVGLSKATATPVTWATLFAFTVAAYPLPLMAQLPTFTGQPSPLPNSPPSIPPAFTGNPQPLPKFNPSTQSPANIPSPSELEFTVTPAAAAAPQATDYILGGGDVVRIEIFSLPQYSGSYSIPIDGSINLPLIGNFSFKGLTIAEASTTLTDRYRKYLRHPLLTVNLLLPRPLSVLIAGEVRRPGTYLITIKTGPGESPGSQYPKLTQALEQAEGITLAADIRNVELRRPMRSGKIEVFKVDLWDLANAGSQRDIYLRDGDSIFVPTSTTPNPPEIRTLSPAVFSLDASRPQSIAVVGEVNRPGSYIVGNRSISTDRTSKLPTVSTMIKEAGGIKPLADIRRIEIRRSTKSGTEQVFNVDLWQLLQTGDIKQDAILQDGDTVIIPTATALNPAEATELATTNFSPDTIQVSVVGEVNIPGQVRVTPNTPLNQALLAAGGFKEGRANKEVVDLIRLNPDGTVSKRPIPLNFAQGINEQSNPMLRNNDIIVVNTIGIASFGDLFSIPAGVAISLLTVPLRIFDFLNLLGILKLR